MENFPCIATVNDYKNMIPGDRNFAEFMDSPWVRFQVETHLLWGNYKYKYLYLIAITIYFMICNLLILKTTGVTGMLEDLDWRGISLGSAMLIGILFGNYNTNAIFWGITKFIFLIMCPSFILIGIVNMLRNEPANVELIITGLLLFPFLEFIPKISNYQKYLTLGRIIILLPICSNLAKIG